MDCKSCKYQRRLKHNFKKGKGYQVDSCCVILANDADGFVIEVSDNECCEMYVKGVNTDDESDG